jgi:hypothetical protein
MGTRHARHFPKQPSPYIFQILYIGIKFAAAIPYATTPAIVAALANLCASDALSQFTVSPTHSLTNRSSASHEPLTKRSLSPH